MYPLDLPVLAPSPLAAPVQAQPQPVFAGIIAPQPEFAGALAGLVALPARPVSAAEGEPDADTGSGLPDGELPTGNILPQALPEGPAPVVPPQPVMIAPAHAAPLPVLVVDPSAHTQPALTQVSFPQPSVPQADPRPGPVSDRTTAAAPLPGAPESAAMLAELFSVVPRSSGDSASPLIAMREAVAAAPLPSSAPAPTSGSLPPPGAQLEQLVEALAQAREAGKGARGEIAVRHGEFGLLAIRIDAEGAETRAQIIARDPGFAPAIVAALAERANTGAADQQAHQRGQDQSWGQHGAANGDARQQERRHGFAETRAMPALRPAEPVPSDPEKPARTEPHTRFA